MILKTSSPIPVIQMIERQSTAIIFDGDGTLYKGRVAQGIGFEYLRREYEHGKYSNVASALISIIKIKFELLRKGKKEKSTKESEGLRLFYETLMRCGLGKKAEMEEYALKYIRANEIGPVAKIARSTKVHKFLFTLGGSTAAEAAARHFAIDAVMANRDIFNWNDQLQGVVPVMKNGEDKLIAVVERLKSCGISDMSSVAVIGDGASDLALFDEIRHKSGLTIASPYAIKEIKALSRVELEPPPDM